MPECDGFPVYTHAYLYEGVDRTSFRGKFLDACEDVISADDIEQAWVPMTASEFGAWGKRLMQAAETAAHAHNATAALNNRSFQPEDNSIAAQIHIVDQAARWAKFWSDMGHGTEPYF